MRTEPLHLQSPVQRLFQLSLWLRASVVIIYLAFVAGVSGEPSLHTDPEIESANAYLGRSKFLSWALPLPALLVHLHRGTPIVHLPLVAFLLYVLHAWTVASLLYPWRATALAQWLAGHLLLLACVLSLALHARQDRRLLAFMSHAFGVVAIGSCLGSLMVGISDSGWGGGRLYGFFVHPNTLGIFACIASVYLLGLIFNRPRPTLVLLLSLTIACSLLTGSRTSQLGILGGLLALFYARGMPLGRLILMAGALIVTILAVFRWTDFSYRTVNTRTEKYEIVLQHILEAPLVGHGPLMEVAGGDGYFAAEGSFFTLMASTGLIGTLLFLAAMLPGLWSLGRTARQSPTAGGHLAAWSIGVGLFFMSTLESLWTRPGHIPLMFVLSTAFIAYLQRDDQPGS